MDTASAASDALLSRDHHDQRSVTDSRRDRFISPWRFFRLSLISIAVGFNNS
ncbi:MAG: hypothetical protein AAF918_15785 [Pseudomonadota bacterium]